MADKIHTITRAEVRAAREQVGFSPIRRPTCEELARFLEFADPGTAVHVADTAAEILEQFTAEHTAASAVIEAALRDDHVTIKQLQAADGPYLSLAQALGGLIAVMVVEKPFGQNSALAGLMFAEHILQMHGIVASLSSSDQDLKGAVVDWCSRIDRGEETRNDPFDGLVLAILGRIRFHVP